jgi:hypothetical protein|tara:strand:+ start:634 stop:1005 length:372 start_codon:yes stop_codon:yes gene_type:complete
MDIHAAFPTKYLKAADIPSPQSFTIRGVEMERMQDGSRKPAVLFHESEQMFILNKTNANALEAMFGRDTNHWANKVIELYQDSADFQGRRVQCIRCRQAAQTAPASAPPQGYNDPAGPDDLPI